MFYVTPFFIFSQKKKTQKRKNGNRDILDCRFALSDMSLKIYPSVFPAEYPLLKAQHPVFGLKSWRKGF